MANTTKMQQNTISQAKLNLWRRSVPSPDLPCRICLLSTQLFRTVDAAALLPAGDLLRRSIGWRCGIGLSWII